MMEITESLPTLNRLIKQSVVAESGCREWAGHIRKDGYAHFKLDGKMQLAHRVSYSLTRGPIPAGMTLDHLCRNKKCIEPSHLEVVTLQENLRRRYALITHCNRGHEFDEENTYRFRGCRYCRKCNNIRTKIYQRKKSQ